MIITKEQQEAWVDAYMKQKHTQEECIGFVDGIEKTMSVIKNITAVKMIAYKDRDIESDTWSERAFLFKNTDDVKAFFTADNSVLLDVYTEEDSRVLNDFEIHDIDGNITSVSFNTKYAGDVRIEKMNEGFVYL